MCALDISKAYGRVDQYALLSLLMDRKVPKYFISIMLNWFMKGYAYVRLGNATLFTFLTSAGVHQGGLLSPLLFAIYINRSRDAGMDVSWHNGFMGVCCMQTILCCCRTH